MPMVNQAVGITSTTYVSPEQWRELLDYLDLRQKIPEVEAALDEARQELRVFEAEHPEIVRLAARLYQST